MCSKVPFSSTLPPILNPLKLLLGTWKGKGKGYYPTINSFEYNETTTFINNGKPFIIYNQNTSNLDGIPMHIESGYIRPSNKDNHYEFIISDATGITSIMEGKLTETNEKIELRFISSNISCSPSAKSVTEVERIFYLSKEDNNKIDYKVNMAAVGEKLTPHLHACLYKDDFLVDKDKLLSSDSNNIIIDVREKDEYEKGHLDALNIPIGKLLSASAVSGNEIYDLIHSNKNIITYCASGGRAKLAAYKLRERGLDNIYCCPIPFSKLK